MRNKNNKLLIISSLFVAVAAVGLYLQVEQMDEVEKPIMADQFQSVLKTNEVAFQQANSMAYGIQTFNEKLPVNLPVSLEGIDLNIELPLDDDGNLVVGMILKDFFEIYLSAMGEEELDDILLRIQAAMTQQLTSPALEQGFDALKRFIDYKVELANLEQQPSNPDLTELENIRQQKAVLAVIQQEYFSPSESDAFFAAEAEYDEFMLEHLTIQQNESLTTAEKQKQIQALANALPDDIREGREAAMKPAKVYQKAIELKASGGTAEDIYQMRSQTLGDEAASALAQLDQERDVWDQRLLAFNNQYQAIQAAGMSSEDADGEVQALLERDFSRVEVIRVKAINGL